MREAEASACGGTGHGPRMLRPVRPRHGGRALIPGDDWRRHLLAFDDIRKVPDAAVIPGSVTAHGLVSMEIFQGHSENHGRKPDFCR